MKVEDRKKISNRVEKMIYEMKSVEKMKKENKEIK
jgi:hypothetical protein